MCKGGTNPAIKTLTKHWDDGLLYDTGRSKRFDLCEKCMDEFCNIFMKGDKDNEDKDQLDRR